jgi:hypothetical protein
LLRASEDMQRKDPATIDRLIRHSMEMGRWSAGEQFWKLWSSRNRDFPSAVLPGSYSWIARPWQNTSGSGDTILNPWHCMYPGIPGSPWAERETEDSIPCASHHWHLNKPILHSIMGPNDKGGQRLASSVEFVGSSLIKKPCYRSFTGGEGIVLPPGYQSCWSLKPHLNRVLLNETLPANPRVIRGNDFFKKAWL